MIAGKSSLAGHLLIAMPQMPDPRFARSVTYLWAHSEAEGAMGIIVNKVIDTLTFDKLYAHLKIDPPMRSKSSQPVHFGGPVDLSRGFVLHSTDYHQEGTIGFGGDFAMTAPLDTLRAIGNGSGPRRFILALGYAGWAPGQLDAEIQANGWLTVAADADLVFDTDNDGKWGRALAKLGVSPEMLSGSIGHA